MSDAPPNYYEQRLNREIAEIEARIKELTEEKEALKRQLRKARQESTGLQDVNRKNSMNRVVIEARIIEALKKSSKPMRSDQLLKEARYVNFELKETTFRTHMYRMKQRGLVGTAGQNGLWRLPSPKDGWD